jgi:O-antigen ligase
MISRNLASWILGFSLVLYLPIVGSIKVVDIVVLIVSLILIKKSIFRKKSTWALSFFVIIIASSTFVNAFAHNYLWNDVLISLGGLILSFIGFLAGISLTSRELVSFCKGYLLSVLIITALSLLSRFQILPFNYLLYGSTSGSFITGTMTDPNRYGYALNIGLIFLLYSSHFYKNLDKYSLLRYLLIAFLVIGVLFTGSRSSLVISLFVIITFLIIELFTKKYSVKSILKSPFYIILISLVFFFIVSYIIPKYGMLFDIFNKLDKAGINYENDPRYQILTKLISLFENQFIIGYGVDGFKYMEGLTSHNSYGEVLISSGIIGFIFYFYILYRNVSLLLFTKAKNKLIENIFIFKKISLLFFGMTLIYMMSLNLHFLLLFYVLLGAFSEFRRHYQ